MTPTLVEISEREVIAAAKAAVASRNDGRLLPTVDAFVPLVEAVALLEERERMGAAALPPPRPGAEPLTRPPKKLSKRQQAIEDRRRSDISGQKAGRDNIDYSSDELPSPS